MIKQLAMALSVYPELARHLDRLPGGFPRTPEGVELRILRRLFTESEARLACRLTLIPEEARVVAYRCRMAADATATRLEAMWRRGLILKHSAPGKPARYMACQFVVGIWEFQVNRLDPALVADMEAYIPTLFQAPVWRRAPQMRTIPVNRSIDPKLSILPHEAAARLIAPKEHFVISPCICRKEQRMAGQGCERPLAMCISFGDADSYFVQAGIGRPVDRQTVMDLLEKADRSGLVIQPSNSRHPAWICCCCGCCCGVLRTVKAYFNPAQLMASAFAVHLDASVCTGCGVCVERCQMDALVLEDDRAQLDGRRCIGCGLCVSTCAARALRLIRKPAREQPPVPANIATALLRTLWKRKKLNPLAVAAEIGRSQRDRYLAGKKAEREWTEHDP